MASSSSSSRPSVASGFVGRRFRILDQIGAGSFGTVYRGADRSGERVAIKFEDEKANPRQLGHECSVYFALNRADVEGFPRSRWFGKHGKQTVLVLDLLGSNLEDLFDKCSRRFSLETVLLLADQMLWRLEDLHNQDFVHRDIKPQNFVMGHENDDESMNTVHLIDFGLSKRWRDANGCHVMYHEGRDMTGTARFASVNAQTGCVQSRRDDLEALGYMLMYFLRGRLPWQGLNARTMKQKMQLILNKKCETPIKDLCEGFPEAFADYLADVRSLEFDEEPDYQGYRQLFRNCHYDHFGRWGEGEFDWEKQSPSGNAAAGQAFGTPEPEIIDLTGDDSWC